MRFQRKVRSHRPDTLFIYSVLVSLCFAFNARLDAAPSAQALMGLAETQSVGVCVATSQAKALTNSINAWARMPSQAKNRVKRPTVYRDALAPGRVLPGPAIRRFSQVRILSDIYSHTFNSRPRGRAPPSIA
jgi:hypothetical protein